MPVHRQPQQQVLFRQPESGSATPGGTGSTVQPGPTSTSTSPTTPSSSPSSKNNDNRITIIASIVGSVAGVIAVVIAWLTYRHMRKGKEPGQQGQGATSPPFQGYQTEMQHMQSPAQSHVYNEESYRQPFYGGQYVQPGRGGPRY
ncbi:MAG: hypothetical protein HETSPECPRED_001303 [Heterodermia speciosa]|uniref:Uncharacterized protein n=1 Tax=Heterodermia speciosa TaxID=116794 RepID=A0A8H3IEK3_9LECA|nr:MAG: hypothetical protein HETSPECPRED_001303 [Heterodermia speciosa]